MSATALLEQCTPPPKRGGQEPPGRQHGIAAGIPGGSQDDVIATDLPANGQSLAFPMNAGVCASGPSLAQRTNSEREPSVCARYRNARESWAFWWRGREALAGFSKTAQHVCRETRRIPTRANGQLAFASYGLDSETGRYSASAIDVFTFDGPRIKEITAFVTPEIFPAFGLPSELAA